MEKVENCTIKKEQARTIIKKREFLDALKKSCGIFAPAMEMAGIKSYETISKWRKNDPAFAVAVNDCETAAGDFVESALLRKIKEGDTTAIIFYCKTKLKNRGYTERTEITGADGGKLASRVELSTKELKAEIKRLERLGSE